MEKINIAELLKNCPKGMELDCIIFNNPVKYESANDDGSYPISIRTEEGELFYLNKYGCLYDRFDSKCAIFPKGKTTWEGFVPTCKFNDGDIITDSLGTCIFKGEVHNWNLVSDKFDITTLNPFDKVLVRDNDEQTWRFSFFIHCNGLETYKYSCINGRGYSQCIPYKGNEHLRGTTNDCDDFYKTWE